MSMHKVAFSPQVIPRRLEPGATIAIVSPSAGSAALYESRFQRGLTQLELLGFNPVPMQNSMKAGRWASGTVRERVADLHEAFGNPRFDAVLCSIGGRGAAHLLGSLDFDLIAGNPKIFCGYSDATALHHAIGARTGLVTFYGPSVLAEFGEYPHPFPETIDSFLRVTAASKPLGCIPRFSRIVVEPSDWSKPAGRAQDAVPQPVVIRSGTGSGPLVGGCLPVLCELQGTPWAKPLNGGILLLETPQHPYSMQHCLANLWHLRNAGQLEEIQGLAVGWPFALDQLDDLVECIATVTAGYDFPVLVGFPFGHTSPMVTLPLGLSSTLDERGLSIDAASVY